MGDIVAVVFGGAVYHKSDYTIVFLQVRGALPAPESSTE